jgi:hypothetical protein
MNKPRRPKARVWLIPQEVWIQSSASAFKKRKRRPKAGKKGDPQITPISLIYISKSASIWEICGSLLLSFYLVPLSLAGENVAGLPVRLTRTRSIRAVADYDCFVLSCDSVIPAVFTACESFDQRHDQ